MPGKRIGAAAPLKTVKSQPVIEADPKSTIARVMKGEDFVVRQGIGNAIDAEFLCAQLVEATAPRGKPHGPGSILQHGHDVVASQSFLDGIRAEARRGNPVQSVTGADPDIFLLILKEDVDEISRTCLVQR